MILWINRLSRGGAGRGRHLKTLIGDCQTVGGGRVVALVGGKIKSYVMAIGILLLATTACTTEPVPIVVFTSPDGIVLRQNKVFSNNRLVYERDTQLDQIAEDYCWSIGKEAVRNFDDGSNAGHVTYSYDCRSERGPHQPIY